MDPLQQWLAAGGRVSVRHPLLDQAQLIALDLSFRSPLGEEATAIDLVVGNIVDGIARGAAGGDRFHPASALGQIVGHSHGENRRGYRLKLAGVTGEFLAVAVNYLAGQPRATRSSHGR